jgi:hypothetical protein
VSLSCLFTRRSANQDNYYWASNTNTTQQQQKQQQKHRAEQLIFLASLYTVPPEALRPIASNLRIVGAFNTTCTASLLVARLKTSARSGAQQLQSLWQSTRRTHERNAAHIVISFLSF